MPEGFVYFKRVYKLPDGRLLSMTAEPVYGPLHPDWIVEYFQGVWVAAKNGLLFVGRYYGDPTQIVRFPDQEVWTCEIDGESDCRNMAHLNTISSSASLESFWRHRRSAFYNSCLGSKELLVERVKLLEKVISETCLRR